MKILQFKRRLRRAVPGILLCAIGTGLHALPPSETSNSLAFSADAKTASYSIGLHGQGAPVLTASVAVNVDGQWLLASDYPQRSASKSEVTGPLGKAEEWVLTYSGRTGSPDLICTVRMYEDVPFGDIRMTARNTATDKTFEIEAFRPIGSDSGNILNLMGPATEDRVLSYSYSEDQPAIAIHDLADADDGMHLGVGSQLIYNRKSGLSWFVGALTSDRYLSVARLSVAGSGTAANISSYHVDSEGTTYITSKFYLRKSPPEDRVQLKLKLTPGAELSSERLLFGISNDYHKQLDTYGEVIRDLRHARVTAPPTLGWWSWTAFYSGISEGAALTNAQFLAQNLKPYGYNFFHIDEGYQYARGEYTTADATLFPDGMIPLQNKVVAMGLVPGLWTAPFEVADRSWVYQHHKDWLVQNTKGQPIMVGRGSNNSDLLYVLDTTNPGAQEYLRKTYTILTRDWHIRYFKLDFMDTAAIEGNYYRPQTTALEAQRIGLEIIRKAVGPDVLLDKDGSPMLNPVGYVDMGRISQDTGHTFAATKVVATGIAARYFMNRNWYVSDPDAFTVSRETIPNGQWHESKTPLTLSEAEASIALAAVSGGMFEIGDDLSTLATSPERLALVKNRDLIDMALLGRASTPIDLMSYDPADEQPSIFFLKEDARQSILTIFNWTEGSRTHKIALSSLGIRKGGRYKVSDVLNKTDHVNLANGVLEVTQPRHSVRVIKIEDEAIPARPPVPAVDHPSSGLAGQRVSFSAASVPGAVQYEWDMGDGVKLEGRTVTHTYTYAGTFTVELSVTGLSGKAGQQRFPISITGRIPMTFVPSEKRRFEAPHE